MFGFLMTFVMFAVGLNFAHNGDPIMGIACFLSSGMYYIGMQIWQIVYHFDKEREIKETASKAIVDGAIDIFKMIGEKSDTTDSKDGVA